MKALVIILILLLLLALTPVGVWLRYDQAGFWLKATAGPVKFQIIPASEKSKAKKEKKKAEAAAEPPKEKKKKKKPKPEKTKEEKKKSTKSLIALVRKLLPVGLEALGSFRKKLVLEKLDLHLAVGGTDPAETAIFYGRVWAGLGNLVPMLERAFILKKRSIYAQLSPAPDKIQVEVETRLRYRIGQLIGIAFKAGWKALWIFLRHKRAERRAAKLAAAQ